jgi:hypothetical protein
MTTDGSDSSVSFEMDIQDLFSQRDQEAMLLQFDLWDVEDVRNNADAILEQVASGRMPCYGAWGENKVALFRRWRDSGMAD